MPASASGDVEGGSSCFLPHSLRLAVPALAAALLSAATASAQPLAMNDPIPFPASIFQQVVPRARAFSAISRKTPAASRRRRRSSSADRSSPTTPARRPAPSSSIRRTPISTTCSAAAARSATASASAATASPGRARRASRASRNGRTGIRRAEMIARQPYLPRFMAGGPGNPLGARAMYLGNSHVPHPRHQRAAAPSASACRRAASG